MFRTTTLTLWKLFIIPACVCVCVCMRACAHVYVCNVSAIAALVAELEDSAAEDKVVSQYTDVSANEKHQMREKVDELLRPLGFETSLLVIRRANSIAVFFTCLTLSAVMSLRDNWCSGQLRDIIEKLFTVLAGTTVTVRRLTWLVTDYERCLLFFSSLQGKQTV